MMFLRLVLTTLFLLMVAGCSDNNDSRLQTTVIQEKEVVNPAMEEDLHALALSSSNAQRFTQRALVRVLPEISETYVPDALQEYLFSADIFSLANLAADENIKGYLEKYYEEVNTPAARAAARSGDTGDSFVSDLVVNLYKTLKEMFFKWINNFFSGGDGLIDENDDEGEVYVPKNDVPIEFTLNMLQGKRFYVISSKADMTVQMSSNGLSGSGSMGLISMNFTDYISTEGLMISTGLMGDWVIDINYLDEGYCIAADAVSEGGDVYESYWFSNASDEAKVTTLKSAKRLCYAHAVAGEEPQDEIIDEGEVTPIADLREGHQPQSAEGASATVDALMTQSASVDLEDAKYFARNMRSGPLSLYTTNGQTHDLMSLETENIMRELMPQGMSSALNMKALLEESYVLSTDFQMEVVNDLNATMNGFNTRMQALAQSASIAMDNAMNAENYYGSHTSSYGDKVEFAAGNLDVNICLVFFLCESSVDGDAYFQVTNPGTDGNSANVAFQTHFEATSMNINAVSFNRVVSSNSVNTISGNGYALNLSGFLFNRNDGTLDLEGMGRIGSNTTPATIANVNAFDMRVYVQEEGTLNFVPRAISAALNGTVESAKGRSFDGKLYFDAQNTENNELNGTLVGADDEPTLEGSFKTSLSFDDIDLWVNGRDDVNFDKGMPYLVDDNGNIELLASLTNFGRVEAKTFERFDNRYNCEAKSDGTYNCMDPFNRVHKSVHFLKDDEVLLLDTNMGTHYVVVIENIRNYSLSTIVLLDKDDRDFKRLGAFDYDQAAVSNIRVVSANINEPYTIDTIGDHSYSMDMVVTKGSQYLSAKMLMKNSVDQDIWEYYVRDLEARDDFGTIKAERIYISQNGENKLAPLLDELMQASFNIEFDVEAMMNYGWEQLSPFNSVEVDGFELNVNGSLGTALIKSDLGFASLTEYYSADMNTSYSYAQTEITALVDAVVTLDDPNPFESSFTASGTIKAADHPDYSYEVDYTKAEQNLLLTRLDTGYQMGFIVAGESARGVDSYGVHADFVMNSDMSVLEKMDIKDTSATVVGQFDRENSPYAINYSNGEMEYLYLY